MNIAQMGGPWLGGMLYEQDGFYLPFLVMGCLQVRSLPFGWGYAGYIYFPWLMDLAFLAMRGPTPYSYVV